MFSDGLGMDAVILTVATKSDEPINIINGMTIIITSVRGSRTIWVSSLRVRLRVRRIMDYCSFWMSSPAKKFETS